MSTSTLSKKDTHEFNLYLQNCTNNQVFGVLEKEEDAGRSDYAELAQNELTRRGLA